MVDSASMKRRLLTVACLIAALNACHRDTRSGEHVGRPDSTRAMASRSGPADSAPAPHPWVPKPILVQPDPKLTRPDPGAPGAADSLRTDSLSGVPATGATGNGDPAADATTPLSTSTDPASKGTPSIASGAEHHRSTGQPATRERRRYHLTPADSARWPVKGPVPLPGSLLPGTRIVAFYGNPNSSRMGILGQLPPQEMLPKLEHTATEWAKADPGRPVMPALHLIATVAQGKPGSGSKYRLRHSDELIQQVLGWAEERGWLVFLDVQIGHSTVPDELARLVKYLERPYVHLALDPEFAMKLGGIPGRRIGTLDATDVNYAVRLLAEIVDRKKLPPKVLVVHRFTQRMLTNHDKITLDPRVQVVVDMDGFGAPYLKEDAYKFFIVPEPVQYAGFKLFFKNDKPMMAPADVIKLWPVPYYIQYQ
jgi:hypothetical protein